MADEPKEERLELIAGAPIRITDGTVMHVRLFHSDCRLGDIWAEEHVDGHAQSVEAAKLLVAQLGDYCNGAFLMALREAVNDKLREHDAQYGTHWAKN